MVITKILKRKDASSIVVAIVLGFILVTLLSMVTLELASKISGANNFGGYPGQGWKLNYFQPLVAAVLQVVLLEVLCWIYVFVKGLMQKKR